MILRLDPVQPTLVKPFHRSGWVYEEKLDGWRIVAYKRGQRVQLVSRTGRDHAQTFPAIAAAVRALPHEQLVLDGEVCAFDAQLVSHMHLGGRDLRNEALRECRSALEDVVSDSELIFPARRLAPDGFEAWRQVQQAGYESLVAKPETSVCTAGRLEEGGSLCRADVTFSAL